MVPISGKVAGSISKKLSTNAIRDQLNQLVPTSGGSANFRADKSQFGGFEQVLNKHTGLANEESHQMMRGIIDSMKLNHGESMKAIPAGDINIEMVSKEGLPQESASSVGDVLQDLLGDLNNTNHNMDELVQQMMNSEKISPRQMIAAQLATARFGLMNELFSNIANQASKVITGLQSMAV